MTWKRHRLIYNDDGGGIAIGATGDPVERLRETYGRVLGHVPLDSFALSVAEPDIMFCRSAAGETVGRRFADLADIERDHMRRIATTIRALEDRGTDSLTVIADLVHEHGVEFLAEMRMSDTHVSRVDPDDAFCPQITIDHPDWIIRRSDRLPDGIAETALDYSFPEVRAHRLAIVRELAGRPEVDGLELNFIRWGKHFVREEAPDKAPIMTEFVGDVHRILAEAARARGVAALTLGVRVPSTLEENRGAGLDPRTWVANGWLDYLAASDFNYSDPQIPIEQFASFTGGTGCALLAQMGDMIGGTWQGKPSLQDRNRGSALMMDNYHGLLNTDPEARAAACNAYAAGADGISFWNLCCNMHDIGNWGGPEHQARMLSWMNAVASPQDALAGPRHYHFLPMWKWPETPWRNYAVNRQYHSPTGNTNCQILTFGPDSVGSRQIYRFRMADGRDGRKVEGTMRFQIFYIEPHDEISVDVNGVAVAPSQVRLEHRPQADPPTTWFEIGLADCPAFRLDNELGITPRRLGAGTEVPYMEELEVFVE